MREVKGNIFYTTCIFLGLGIIWYGFCRFGKQIKHLYKEGNKMKQRLNDLKDELGDYKD